MGGVMKEDLKNLEIDEKDVRSLIEEYRFKRKVLELAEEFGNLVDGFHVDSDSPEFWSDLTDRISRTKEFPIYKMKLLKKYSTQ